MAADRRKILLAVGTRPEALKLAPVVQALHACHESFEVRVCATGQHREMLDQALKFMSIVPDYDLKIMSPNQRPSDVAARVLYGMDEIFTAYEPDLVLVQGDTTTALAAALAAYYRRIPSAHVEAGLRTGNNYAPWPEEGNRRLLASLARFHFAPTEAARGNLLSEGIAKEDIYVTGNTIVDALADITGRFKRDDAIYNDKAQEFSYLHSARRLILVTSHRRENIGAPMERICRALKAIVIEHTDIELLFPVHLNPNVRGTIHDILGSLHGPVAERVHLTEPVDYFSFVYLMMQAHIIITDSGGIQEESPSLGVPTLVLRESTERPEAVEAGCTLLVGTDEEKIVHEANRLLGDVTHHEAMGRAVNPYGDGTAGQRIADILAVGDWP